jgi:uncharacterized protein
MLFEPCVQELSFAHRGDRLVGDLVLPPWPGPHPGVVFVEGSGPGGRDQGPWPTRLAAAGFASLAYDKPGSGASTGDWTGQSLTDRAEETAAAVQALSERAEIQADAIALFGGSQGGWVSHLAATIVDGAVAAVVATSGPGVDVLTQEEYRLRHQLPAQGFDQHDIDTALTLLHEQVDQVRAGEDPAVVHTSQAAWHDTEWYPLLAGTSPQTIGFLALIADYDPVPALAKLECPLLAIFGADDLLVPVEDSIRAITTTLTRSGHRDHQIVVFPRADHSIRVYTGHEPPRVQDGHYEPGQAAPGYPELVVTWLQRHLARHSRAPRPRSVP